MVDRPALATGQSSDVAVPAFRLPYSSFASLAAQELFVRQRDLAPLPSDASIEQMRAHYDAINADRVGRLREIFPVEVRSETLDGVRVDRVIPLGGAVMRDSSRVLVNLHGGAFLWGAGSGALVEAIPIAVESGMEVVAIDYRQGPEWRFPAACEDVATVYRVLLKDRAPGAVGIYGCSAGGLLAAQTIVWFRAQHLPIPGAVGTFCGSLIDFTGGDSLYLASVANGQPPDSALGSYSTLPYFADARADDPLIFPNLDPAALKVFPPTLLIAGTRDFAMSSVLHSNELLTASDVSTELHVWEGMGHAFFSDPEPEESRQAYRVVARFFRRELSANST